MRQTSLARLFDAHHEKLGLQLVCGSLDAIISISDDKVWPADLVGHLNLIHPGRLQVVGAAELAWAQRQSREKVGHILDEILAARPPAIIVADGCDIPAIVNNACDSHGITLLTTPAAAASVVDLLRLHLSRQLAEKISLHGVLMDVLGIGVFVTGDSGSGKSELALELISRGHGLVADDIVEFSRIAPTVLEGRSPDLLTDFLEVRGLGILNIRTIFGETACRRKMRLRLVVHLEKRQPGQHDPLRLPDGEDVQNILDVPLPRVVLPVAAGRNIAVLLEAAVRTTILKFRGIDTTQDFIERQKRALEKNRQ